MGYKHAINHFTKVIATLEHILQRQTPDFPTTNTTVIKKKHLSEH